MSRLNFLPNFVSFALTMVENLTTKNCMTIFEHMGCIMRQHAPKQHNKIVLRRGNTTHILEIARALLITANAPQRYWIDAVAMAVYLLNRMPSKELNFKTLLQALAHHVNLPSILLLPPQIFGCVAYVHLHKN